MDIADYNGNNETFQRLLTEEAKEGAVMQLSISRTVSSTDWVPGNPACDQLDVTPTTPTLWVPTTSQFFTQQSAPVQAMSSCPSQFLQENAAWDIFKDFNKV